MIQPMHFLWPELLWLLWAIPLLVLGYAWLLRRRRQPALRYANVAMVRQAMLPGRVWRRHLPPALLLVALAVLLFAAARPQAALPLPTGQSTVVLAVDVSLSMQADDIKPSRLDAAREAAKAFVRQLPDGARVGLVSFAGTAQVVQPPTYSREKLLAAIDALHLQHGTAMGSGIVAALSELFPNEAMDLGEAAFRPLTAHAPRAQPKPVAQPFTHGAEPAATIVLLTDGRSNFGVHPLQAADMAAARGVRIHAVGLGTVDTAGADQDDWSLVLQLDEDMLREVTGITHGDYLRAGSAESLLQAYEKMGARLQVQMRETELSGPLALGALLLMAGAALLSLLWCQRVA
ncbi:VWA domain-containing protein [Pseudorhodoferax soli]|uniref:Ca-activated chloride channel family protein n=1 Tax=Pseudorhodoferax soli TaxID=545864 RepID=A0A368XP74_9BURK|nr:VWA domain-containing protein [Pseudorhodoferax soli]RCW68818.1 Ca-activated chloride channel family protein [Pseudorhodoferax soli]